MRTWLKLVYLDWISEERDKYVWEDRYRRPWDEIIGRMYLLKANDALEEDHYADALTDFDQALALLAKDGIRQKEYYCCALTDKALALCFLEQYATALSTVEQALSVADPFYRSSIEDNRGSILVLNGAFSEALDVLDARLKQSPKDNCLLFTRATCLLHMERYDESITAYEQARAEDKSLEDNNEGLESARQHQQPDWDEL